MADETTYGTAVTVTRFLEFNTESIKQSIGRIESTGLRPSRRVVRSAQWAAARISVDGDIEFDVSSNGFGLLFKHALGAIATSQPNAGSNPTVYEHLATVGATDGKSFTAQIGAGDTGGTIDAFTWAGCKIAKWELHCDENGFLVFKPTITAANESTAVGLASASYSAGAVPLTYVGGALTLAGTATAAKKFSLMGDNKLKADRYFMKAATPQQKKEPLEESVRDYTGTIDVEFMGLTEYNRFVNGTTGALTAFFTGANISGAYSYAVEVTLPYVRYDGVGPEVQGDKLIDLSLPIKVLDSADANGPVQIKYRTTDATP